MSALTPKADIRPAQDVRFVPLTDIDDSSLAMLGCRAGNLTGAKFYGACCGYWYR